MVEYPIERPRYRPSGRIEPGALFVHAGVVFGVALLLAAGLAWAVRLDGYALGVLAEVVILVGLPTVVGWGRASRPFSERTNRWFSRDVLTLTPESAAGLRRSVRDGTVAEWVRTSLVKTMTNESHATVTIWY